MCIEWFAHVSSWVEKIVNFASLRIHNLFFDTSVDRQHAAYYGIAGLLAGIVKQVGKLAHSSFTMFWLGLVPN